MSERATQRESVNAILVRTKRLIGSTQAGWVAWVLIVVAAVQRLVVFAFRRSLSLDEAMLSLNIAGRSFRALLLPLTYRQVAPIPFLIGERLMVRIGGVNERSLRAIPLACGIGALAGLWLVGRRLLGARTALAAVALAATSQPLAHYSVEVKQYALDVVITLVAVALCAAVLRDPASPTVWRRLAVGGALAIGFAQPAPFVLAGAACALAVDQGVRTTDAWRRRWVLTVSTWGAAFVGMYLLAYRAAANDLTLRWMWSGTFLTPSAEDLGRRLADAVRVVLTASTDVPAWLPLWLLGALFAAGLISITRRHGVATGVLLAVPYGAVGLAAALERYPVARRLLLFTAPLTLLVYAAGCIALLTVVRPSWRHGAFATMLAALLVTLGGWLPQSLAGAPGEWRDLVEAVQRMRGGEPVYVLRHTIPQWAFYTTDWTHPDLARLRRLSDIYTYGRPVDGVRAVPGSQGGELISDALGVRWNIVGGWSSPAPDSAWSSGEARRIEDAASPGAWIITTGFEPPGTLEALIKALRATGGFVTCTVGLSGGAAFYTRLGGPDGGPNAPVSQRCAPQNQGHPG